MRLSLLLLLLLLGEEVVLVGSRVVPWNWGSMTVLGALLIGGERDSTELEMSLVLLTRLKRGEPAFLWPSLWMAKCSLEGVCGRNEPLMFCLRDGSGVLRPKRDSKESRLR